MTLAPQSHPRFSNIDALRALAAVLVLWTHTTQYFVQVDATHDGMWLNQIPVQVDIGRMGVVIFFLVSGFVIPATLKGTGWRAAKAFVVNRFFRMYPLFWASIVLGVPVCFWLFGRGISATDVLLNIPMFPIALGAVPVQGLYWTLEVELIFYLCCLCLFALGRLQDTRVLAAIAAAGTVVMFVFLLLVLTGLNHKLGLGYKKATLFAHLALMFFGALCRKYADGTALSKPVWRCAAAIVLAWVVLFPAFGLLVTAQAGAVYKWNFFAPYPVAVCVFLIGALTISRAPDWMAWLGLRSYSIYLLHPPVFLLLMKGLEWTGDPALLQMHLGVYVALVLVLTTLASAATFAWIEQPCIRLGRRIAGRPHLASAPANAGYLESTGSPAH